MCPMSDTASKLATLAVKQEYTTCNFVEGKTLVLEVPSPRSAWSLCGLSPANVLMAIRIDA